jgi:CubicO group peptidase (beta-lactamase class C family)
MKNACTSTGRSLRGRAKTKVTVRQLLAHQAGLHAFDEPVDRAVVADLDRLAAIMARQKPAWEPGTR